MVGSNEPIDYWEADLWPLFDRLKSAMDRQEEARLAGKLDEFIDKAKTLFWSLEEMTEELYTRYPIKTGWVYLTWKASRKINQWVPDRDLPLRWYLAEWVPCPLPTAEAVEKIKAKHRAWAEADKLNRKTVTAAFRKSERERKKNERRAAKANG